MVLARLLGPKDFGLVGMVTAFTGVLNLVPRFWAFVCRRSAHDRHRGADFNIILDQHIAWSAARAYSGSDGAGYRCLLRRASALWGDGCSGAGFLFNAAGVQHSALLQRQMRFTALAVISVVSLIVELPLPLAGPKLATDIGPS